MNMRRWLFCLTLLASVVFIVPLRAPASAASGSAASGPAGVIAYTTGNSTVNDQLRLIQPDGSDDHLIWSAPDTAGFGISGIDWRPDGRGLAFVSDHERARSVYESDVYTVDPQGQALQRLTNGPDPSAFASYGTGTVTVNVNVGASGGPFLVYVLGAPAPQVIGTSGSLTFEGVADFGPGVYQPVVAIEGFRRWITPGVAPDVEAGSAVSAGTLLVSGDGLPYRALAPSWRADSSSVGFVFGSGCGQFRQVAANPGPAELGSPLASPDFLLGYTCLLERGPTAATANQILYSEYDIDAGRIYRTIEGSAAVGDELLQYDSAERLLDMRWLPDGSGFVYTLTSDFQARGNIYLYSFGSGQSTPLTDFASDFAYHVSVSPDGQVIAFDRVATLDGVASIWLVGVDGSNMHQLVAQGAFPAWSPAEIHTASFRAFLPFVSH
jgi:TolB protein